MTTDSGYDSVNSADLDDTGTDGDGDDDFTYDELHDAYIGHLQEAAQDDEAAGAADASASAEPGNREEQFRAFLNRGRR